MSVPVGTLSDPEGLVNSLKALIQMGERSARSSAAGFSSLSKGFFDREYSSGRNIANVVLKRSTGELSQAVGCVAMLEAPARGPDH